MRNRIVETEGGYNCIVNGQHFGTWRSREEAKAGLATELRRAQKRQEAATNQNGSADSNSA